MDKKEKTTAPVSSAPTDAELPSVQSTTESITDKHTEIKEKQAVSAAPESPPGKETKVSRDPRHLNTMTMKELYDSVYQSRPPVINGLLYPGTYLFVGAPKLGKSFLMLEFAYHVATGTDLWEYPVRKGTVLYLALEDENRRLQDRLYRMFGMECTENLYLGVEASQLHEGLLDQLENFVREHPDTGLIIIDTLQKIREIGDDRYSYANDYEVITRLKEFTDRKDICLLLVHHTRKQQADDKFEMISGTNGLMGAADGAFLLHKDKRTSCEAVLEVSGRDQPDQTLYLNRNAETLVWDLEKAEAETFVPKAEPVLEALAAFITVNNPDWCGRASELVDILKLDMNPNTLTMKLNINASRLLNEYGIRYENKRNHDGRQVLFHLEPEEA